MRRKIPFLLAPLLMIVLASADTVTLKSGEKLEGKITAETETQVTMDVKVSAGITDERVIEKAEIEKIEKVEPDAIAWQSLQNLKPGANSMPVAQYDAAIRQLEEFTTQYPQSKHGADAKKAADAFKEEKKRVEGGEMKLDGKWLSQEEVQREKYQISAQIAFSYMKELVARRDYPSAMNAFDTIEKQYIGARIYPEAVTLARQILPILKSEADRRLQAIPGEKAEIERGLNLASETGKAEIRAGVQREEARAAAALAAARKQQLNWMPFLPKSEEALKANSDRATNEAQRLSNTDLTKIRESFTHADAAQEAIAKGEVEKATEALQKARSLWHQNEIAARVEKQLAEARATAAAAPPPPPQEEPKPETPADPEPAPAPAAEAAVAAESAPAAEEYAEDAAEPSKPFLLTPFGVIVLLILIAFAIVVFNAVRKMKSGGEEEVIE